MKGFISYAHEDIALVRACQTHLAAIKRSLGVDFWMDNGILAGRRWSAEIEKAIAAADVFLLFCSPAFIASEYIYTKELPAIRKRQRNGALVITVVLELCYWQMVSGVLQAVPTEDGNLLPVSEWKPRRKGLDATRQQIGAAVESYFGLAPKSVQWGRR
jgi:hypothetical protein